MDDDECSPTLRTRENIDITSQIFLEDKLIAESVKIDRHWVLNMKKVYTKMVSRALTPEQIEHRKKICTDKLQETQTDPNL